MTGMLRNAIKTICAKPIIDILLEVPLNTLLAGIKDELTKNGYTIMSEEELRMSFNRGYIVHGFWGKRV